MRRYFGQSPESDDTGQTGFDTMISIFADAERAFDTRPAIYLGHFRRSSRRNTTQSEEGRLA